jgi:hypothetical protein
MQNRVVIYCILVSVLLTARLYADTSEPSQVKRRLLPEALASVMSNDVVQTNSVDARGVRGGNFQTAPLPPELGYGILPTKRHLPTNIVQIGAFSNGGATGSRQGKTNFQNPLESQLSTQILFYEQQLNDSGLDPNVRRAYEALLADKRIKLADFRTNAQLWMDVHSARKSGSQEQISQSEQALANYLSARLGRIQNKTFPSDMSLPSILEEYKAAGRGRIHTRSIVKAILLVTIATPLLGVIIFFWRNRMKPQ